MVKTNKQKIFKHLGNVAMAVVSLSLITASVGAIESSQAAGQVLATEGGRAVKLQKKL